MQGIVTANDPDLTWVVEACSKYLSLMSIFKRRVSRSLQKVTPRLPSFSGVFRAMAFEVITSNFHIHVLLVVFNNHTTWNDR